MPNIGSYEIQKYTVQLPSGQTVDRKKIVYKDSNGQQISQEAYREQPINPSYVDNTDPVYAVSQLTFTMDVSEDITGCDGVSNRFIKRAGENYTNITPFVAWTDCVLIGIAISSREASQWEAILYIDDEETSIKLSTEGERVARGNYEFKVPAGSRISVFVNGEDIQNPGVQMIFTAVIQPPNKETNSK